MKKYRFILLLIVICIFTQHSLAVEETYDSYWAKEDAKRKQEAIEAQWKIDSNARNISNQLRKEDTQRKVKTTIDSILMRSRNMVNDKVVRTQAQIQADKIISESRSNIKMEEEQRLKDAGVNSGNVSRNADLTNSKSLNDAKLRLDKAIEDRNKNDNDKTSDAVVKAYEDVEKILKGNQKALPEVKSNETLTPSEYLQKKEQVKLKIKNDLQNIKDPMRKSKVQNVASNFEQANKNVTDQAADSVSKMESVLLTIESRTNDLIAQGSYVGDLRTQISSAQVAILDAKSAIGLQQMKIYTPEIVDDSTVKNSLQITRNQMKNDLDIMKDKIKAAHSAVKSAYEGLKTFSDLHKNNQVQ